MYGLDLANMSSASFKLEVFFDLLEMGCSTTTAFTELDGALFRVISTCGRLKSTFMLELLTTMQSNLVCRLLHTTVVQT